MNFPHNVATRLDVLSEALEGSRDDLYTILTVLVDDLSAGISSFVGLSITVATGGAPLTITAMKSDTAAFSILLPPGGASTAGDHIVLYANNPDAFTDVAADARAIPGSGGDIILDGHLPPPNASAAHASLTALADRSNIDQAVGFLIEQGHPPEQAMVELSAAPPSPRPPRHRRLSRSCGHQAIPVPTRFRLTHAGCEIHGRR